MKIIVAGDRMTDEYAHGRRLPCQDGCWKFDTQHTVMVPGGAANAARSLEHAGCEVVAFYGAGGETKTRYLEDGRIVFRVDCKSNRPDRVNERLRMELLNYIGQNHFDSLYLSDYNKGFLTDGLIRTVIQGCHMRGVPVVIDPKRPPDCCAGAILKCNGDYALQYNVLDHSPRSVITHAHLSPTVFDDTGVNGHQPKMAIEHEACANHVGAGDCFGAWLTYGLAQGMSLRHAAMRAHAAGRVYVRHQHNRPPWPHEITRELHPVTGKLMHPRQLAALRNSVQGRIVFAPGVFRIPGPGHFWLLDWAKKQGDVLVVGVNSDQSADAIRPGEFCLPLEDRGQMLASHQSVDWMVAFDDNTPVELVKLLKPDLMVKGHDRAGERIPGDDLCETVFAPQGPFPGHVTELIDSIRG